jgi:phosphoribosylformylglycinamidine (FGAM) synthase PurS component
VLRAVDRAVAVAEADAMCRRLLAIPVVEEYVVTVGRPRRRV